MRRQELRSELAFLVNFTEATAAQDFIQARLNKVLNSAYNKLVERAKINASREFFVTQTDGLVWPAVTQTLTVPSFLANKSIISVLDVTNGEPGTPLVFGLTGQDAADLFWATSDKWQWATVGGPPAAVTLRVFYEGVAENLGADDDEPKLIQPQFHMLIVWEAAILLRLGADEAAPRDWKDERDELQQDYFKHVSRGRPTSHVRRVINSDGIVNGVSNNASISSVTSGTGLNPP